MRQALSALIPCVDGTGDWFAIIEKNVTSGELFEVEAVRQINPERASEVFKTGSRSPFENSVIPCFLNFASKGTLGNVEVLSFSIGETGPSVIFETQSVKAQAQYILFGEDFEIDFVPAYERVCFVPAGLRQWLSEERIRPQTDHFASSSSEVESFDLAGIGKLKIFFAHEGNISIGAETKTFVPYVSVDFDNPRSFAQIDSICSLLDSLFSFLTMTAVEPAELTLTPSGMQLDTLEHHSLFRSGVRWHLKSDECGFSNFLSKEDVPSLRGTICKAVEACDEVSFLLTAINESLQFSERCDKSFGLVFPRIEMFLDSWFSGDDEVSYLGKEKKFFDYVDASEDKEIIDFCKKHIEIKKSKKRGTKQRLILAIEKLNVSLGCNIDVGLANRIIEFRNSQFHGASLKKTIKALEACEEVSMACDFMLTAFILEILQIDRKIYGPKLRSLFPNLYSEVAVGC